MVNAADDLQKISIYIKYKMFFEGNLLISQLFRSAEHIV